MSLRIVARNGRRLPKSPSELHAYAQERKAAEPESRQDRLLNYLFWLALAWVLTHA